VGLSVWLAVHAVESTVARLMNGKLEMIWKKMFAS
jgi:hypothetical protein